MSNIRKFVQEANIALHSQLAEKYDEQPHFKPENQKLVQNILKGISEQTQKGKLLDLGCGTGFVLELAHSYFDELYGVDITPKMLEIAEKKFSQKGYKNIFLKQESTDKMSLPDNYFDCATAYSYLHHLPSPLPTLREAYRTLKKGGIFYADLDPNFYFWQAVKDSAKTKNVSELLKKDILSICDMTSGYKGIKSVKADAVRGAEYIESSKGGFKEESFIKAFQKAGFKDVKIEYHWFWEEAKVIRELSVKDARYFEEHLRLGLPVTRSFFKYMRTIARK